MHFYPFCLIFPISTSSNQFACLLSSLSLTLHTPPRAYKRVSLPQFLRVRCSPRDSLRVSLCRAKTLAPIHSRDRDLIQSNHRATPNLSSFIREYPLCRAENLTVRHRSSGSQSFQYPSRVSPQSLQYPSRISLQCPHHVSFPVLPFPWLVIINYYCYFTEQSHRTVHHIYRTPHYIQSPSHSY